LVFDLGKFGTRSLQALRGDDDGGGHSTTQKIVRWTSERTSSIGPGQPAGAAWIDSGCLALWLIANGHTPAQTELVVNLPARNSTSKAAVDTFVTISTRLWDDISSYQPGGWTSRMAAAASQWAARQS
jgi:hypothetical protein